jgi:outer membrane protein assembly factor BamB/TolA-binding protein
MSAKKLVQLLQDAGLLEESVVAGLRKQIVDRKPTAEAIAKALVDRRLLTRFQATKFIAEATAELEAKKDERAAKKKEKPSAPPPDEDLGLAPLDDDEENELLQAPPAKALEKDEVVMLEDAGDSLTPVEDAGAALTPVGDPAGLSPIESTAPSSQLEELSDSADSDPFGDLGQANVRMPRLPKKKGNVWETKLIFGGGMALILLVIVGAVLYVNLTKTPAIEMWDAAMEDYRSESYSQAQATLEEFLEAYPEDEHASETRVRIAICKIRTVLSDPQKGLDRANSELAAIEPEDSFPLARDELPTILIEIPEGFVRRAKGADDMKLKEELVAKAESGMELVNNPNYVPSSRRSAIQDRVSRAVEDINLVHRDIDQDRDLATAINDIDSAATSNQTVRAYQIFKDLLRKYPALARDGGLLDAVRKVTEKELALVRVVEEPLEALTTDTPRTSDFRVVLASRKGDGASRLENRVAAIQTKGSVYALAAGTGGILWSRFVGHGTQVHPVRVSSQADADLLIVDGHRHDLLRVTPLDGKVVWRLPIGEPFATPVSTGRMIYVSTESGKLREIDPETGTSSRYVEIPQMLTVPPTAAPNRPLLFQVGQHSNLYVINSQTLECQDVFYLGHKDGTVDVPALVHSGHVFVAVNATSDRAELLTLAMNAEGEATAVETAQKPIRLRGNVSGPLQLYGRRLMSVTDRGEVLVFDIDVNKDPPISPAATLAPTRQSPVAAFPLTDASSLWIADDRLTKYRVQVTTKQINRQDITNTGDTFVAPLQLFGDVLVYAARPRDSSGIEVAAVHIDSPRQTLWETKLGVPAGRVAVDEQTRVIHVISAAASLFKIDSEVLKSGFNDQPESTAPAASGASSFTEQIELSDGRIAFFNPATPADLLIYLPNEARRKLRVVSLQLPEGDVTAAPVGFQGGLLVPMSNGDVLLIDPQTGKSLMKPFQPRLEPGDTLNWQRPAVVGESGDEFVIADDRGNVYRVGVKEQHLAEIARNKLDVIVDSPLAAVGDTVYGIARGSGTDVVLALEFDELKLAKEFDLQGSRVTWGPLTVGEAVLLVTDDRQLHAFGAEQKERWQNPATAYGKPAGLPLVNKEDYVFAALNGAIWSVSSSSGQALKKSELGEPLGSGPVAFGNRLLLCGNDGSVHVVAMPAGS